MTTEFINCLFLSMQIQHWYVFLHIKKSGVLLKKLLILRYCNQFVINKGLLYQETLIYSHFFGVGCHSHSLTSSFPQLLFALFWANFREISRVLLRFSLYSLCSQPVWYCFGIKVWYQFSEKSAEKKSVILFE